MGQTALIFDTETTGLIHNHTTPQKKQPEIIEFYGARWDLDSGKLIEDFDTLICPKQAITLETTKITRLAAEDFDGKPNFGEVSGKIKDLIESSDVVVAHNLSFDMEMIDLEFERLNRYVTWPAIRICTVEQTAHLKGFRLNLNVLHEHLFGKKFDEAHRARTDTEALIRCVEELRKRGMI